VGSCGRAPQSAEVCVGDLPCYGYSATCWRRWPEECGSCPQPQPQEDCRGPVTDAAVEGEILSEDGPDWHRAPAAVPAPAELEVPPTLEGETAARLEADRQMTGTDPMNLPYEAVLPPAGADSGIPARLEGGALLEVGADGEVIVKDAVDLDEGWLPVPALADPENSAEPMGEIPARVGIDRKVITRESEDSDQAARLAPGRVDLEGLPEPKDEGLLRVTADGEVFITDGIDPPEAAPVVAGRIDLEGLPEPKNEGLLEVAADGEVFIRDRIDPREAALLVAGSADLEDLPEPTGEVLLTDDGRRDEHPAKSNPKTRSKTSTSPRRFVSAPASRGHTAGKPDSAASKASRPSKRPPAFLNRVKRFLILL